MSEQEQQSSEEEKLKQSDAESCVLTTEQSASQLNEEGQVLPTVSEPEIQTVGKVKLLKRDLGLSSLTGGLSFSLVVLIYICLNLLTLLIIKLAHINTHTDLFTYIGTLISPIAICVTVAVAMRVRKVKFKEICPVKTNPRFYLLAVMLTFGLFLVGTFASGIFLKILELFGYSASESFIPDLTGVNIIPAIIFIAIIPALFEELMFRGVILHCAEKSMGSIRAILVTGFCFALMHGSPQQTIHQFLLGCAIAFLTIRSGSVIPGMLTHFLNNLLALIISSLYSNIINIDETLLGLAMLLIIKLSFAALIGAVIWLIFDRKNKLSKCQKGGVKVFFISATLGIVIMSIMWILNLFSVL